MSVHEWTDRLQRKWCAIGDADLPPRDVSFIVSKEVGDEILRLAEEVERLNGPAMPSGLPGWKEPDRAYVDGRNEGRLDERARIRRELLGEIDPKLAALKARNASAGVDPLTIHDSACIGLLSELRRALDRIVPEEG